MTDLPHLQAELRALLGSWEYAFAMGHGCSIGDHPRHQETRRRVGDLRARIAELTEDPYPALGGPVGPPPPAAPPEH